MIIRTSFINNFIGAVLAISLVGFMSGSANSWSSPVIPKLQSISDDNPFGRVVTTFEISWMTSLIVLGSCMGCWIFGYLLDVIGRRYCVCILAMPMAISYLLMAVFRTMPVFYAARFIMGFTIGGSNIVQMTFVGEISSKDVRGTASTIAGTMIGLGGLFSYCLGPWVSVTTFNIVLAVNPIAVIMLSFIFCEESPYFFLMKGKEEQAKEALRTYRKAGHNIEEELAEIKAKIKEQQSGNIMDIIKTKAFIRSFITANMLLIFQQLTGINGIMMYSQTIFDKTNTNLSSAICAIILGALQLFSGAVAPVVAERFNRRSLMVLSSVGMIVFETILGIYCVLDSAGKMSSSFGFLPMLTLALFMFSYNFGIGPLCWVITSEVYATRIKTLALSFTVFTYYVIGFFIAQYFNSVSEAIGIGVLFFIFAGFCVACILFIWLYVIETRGKTLEQIQDALEHR